MTESKFAPLTELLAPSRLQPINLRVKACLIEEARRHNVNISEVLGRALFVDIQDDLLSFIATRVVIPLTPRDRNDFDAIPTLAPTITVEGKRYVLLAPQLMHLKASQLGPVVAQLEADRHDVLRSVEMIFRGL